MLGSACAHLSAVLLGWHGASPELSLELPAVLSPQPLPLCPGQGALDLWGWARLAPAPCLADSRVGSDGTRTQCCQRRAGPAQGPCGLPLTLLSPCRGCGCDTLLWDGSSSIPCPALARARLSPPWLLLLSPCLAVWGQGRRMSVTWGAEEGCSDGE